MRKSSGRYTVFLTKMGWVGLAASEDGLYAAVLPKESRAQADAELLASVLHSRNPFIPTLDSGHFAEVEEQLQKYFLGRQNEIRAEIDWSWATPFQRRVLSEVLEIPAGTVRTYKDIAERVGSPGGARAVGGALGANRIPLIIPCHRVISAGGKLGGFTGAGLEVKSALIDLEKSFRRL